MCSVFTVLAVKHITKTEAGGPRNSQPRYCMIWKEVGEGTEAGPLFCAYICDGANEKNKHELFRITAVTSLHASCEVVLPGKCTFIKHRMLIRYPIPRHHPAV